MKENKHRSPRRTRRKILNALSQIGWMFLFVQMELLHAEETFSIGFPQFTSEVNYLSSDHPLAFFVKASATSALTTPSSDPLGYKLDLADQLSVGPKYDLWSFRLKRGGVFSNGRPLTARDVKYSLELCSARGRLPGLAEISPRKRALAVGLEEEWIDLKVTPETGKAEQGSKVPKALAACPVIEESSSTLFESALGFGTNLVSAGDYALTGFKRQNEVHMQRISSLSVSTESGRQLLLRGFKDLEHGLTALRMGTVDVLFTDEPKVLEKARADETLVLAGCGAHSIIKRRGLEFPCDGKPRAAKMRYVF